MCIRDRDWIRIYKTDGPESLLSPKTNKRYSKELKLQAVHAYLSGEGSLDEICVKFGIRQHSQLSSWIKAYNEGKELKELTGGSAMKKARKTTLEERICIVKDCLDPVSYTHLDVYKRQISAQGGLF